MPLISYNQVSMPSFMYGTAWKKERTKELVELAVNTGFSAIDTANQLIHYQEALVGEALLSLYKNGVKRESLFLQTKFTNVHGQDHRTPYDAAADLTRQVNQSFKSSLEHLHTEYLDSYILHGPYFRVGISQEDREIWQAIEAHYKAEKTRLIGVSNVSAEQLAELISFAEVKPMIVQNRCYAITGWDGDVREICLNNGIIYQGFSLLTANSRIFGDPRLQAICARLKASPAQIIFCMSLKLGMQVLTGTSSQTHMKEDLKAAELEMTQEEVDFLERIAI